MYRLSRFGGTFVVWSAIALLAGCATSSTPSTIAPVARASGDGADVFQFDPIPIGEIGAQDLDPVIARTTSEMLEAARAALNAANTAKEQGNNELAYQQYMIMMENLLDADLDPALFYTMRRQFDQILDTTTKLAKTYERLHPPEWTDEVVELAFRSELDFPNPLNKNVLAEIEAIQRTYPKSFQSGLNRSARYLPYIREEFRKAGLPQDLVWLAMVESQFTPRINSRAGAGGMWQFMKSTGRRYGLSSDYYLDERYDWQKSTKASIAYLNELYEIFDRSWPLAVSAYNMGEAGLERAVAANRGERDLWRLIESSSRIRRETKRFYAKLLASVIVSKDPKRYGFTYTPQSELRLASLQVEGSYSLRDLERAAGLPEETLNALNPQLLRGITPPGRRSHIYVPEQAGTTVARALKTLPKLRPGTHIVGRGETLSEIAGIYRVPMRELQRTNNIKSPRSLQIGQRLVIPGRMASGTRPAASNASGRLVHAVGRGDSLSKIASRNRVTVRQLQTWNNLGNGTQIHIGDRLYVSKAPTAQSTVRATASTAKLKAYGYTVKQNDSLSVIATKYGVRLNDLLDWNGLTSRSVIRVGQKLSIYLPEKTVIANTTAPTAAPTPESAKPATRQHIVARGENPWTIAKKHGVQTNDLLAWNGLTTKSVVRAGDVLYTQDPKSAQVADAVLVADAQTSPPPSTEIIHIVKRGQNPSTIAQRYGVPLRDLYRWNNWPKDPVLQIGQKVTINKK